mmetsp:Transcript_3952/g.9951  ORF Transcript_3952/g.9951 Transcript_3952/m.9951 type:complete len:223 (+) Transcript_3952:889-1557(+)
MPRRGPRSRWVWRDGRGWRQSGHRSLTPPRWAAARRGRATPASAAPHPAQRSSGHGRRHCGAQYPRSPGASARGARWPGACGPQRQTSGGGGGGAGATAEAPPRPQQRDAPRTRARARAPGAGPRDPSADGTGAPAATPASPGRPPRCRRALAVGIAGGGTSPPPLRHSQPRWGPLCRSVVAPRAPPDEGPFSACCPEAIRLVAAALWTAASGARAARPRAR